MASIYLLVPMTSLADQWIDDNLQLESWQRLGGNIGIGHRYIEDIVHGMMSDGLEFNKDFSVEG